jgi:4-amino-4-deoxy-L-arabinose transferase-like glycosyltransferase
MLDQLQTETRTSAPFAQWLKKYWAPLVVGLVFLLALGVRVQLRAMPLERDEGEYAFAGQLILQGVPPYQEAYNMKLPGTYCAYALIMAVFGQSPSGIHFGVALVNGASIVLLFLLGRKLLDDLAGAAAAVSFALLSLSPSVLGLAGHATHFVVLPALAGVLLLVSACDREPATPNLRLLAISGGLFGLAFLMKQHGLFFGIFGGLYLVWDRLSRWLAARPARGAKAAFHRRPVKRKDSGEAETARPLALPVVVFSLGFVLPYALTCLWLWKAGVFKQFVFWTISYAGRYASAVPLIYGPELLRAALNAVAGPNLLFWILPWAGALVMWWEPRLEREGTEQASGIKHARFFLIAFLLCSLASVCVGFHFREHYFITLLPALALLSGVAFSRAVHLLQHDTTIELFLAIPILGLFAIASLWALIGNGPVWFATPAEANWGVYHTTLFAEAVKAADYVKAHSRPEDRIAVIGSEPEIYFYARRKAATGYLYTYPLMEVQAYAGKMQEEMGAEIERARPEYVVYVHDDLSWLPRASSEHKIDDWWKAYWAANLEVVRTFNIEQAEAEKSDAEPAWDSASRQKYLLLLKRKPLAGAGAVTSKGSR